MNPDQVSSKQWVFSFDGRYGDYLLQKGDIFPSRLLDEMTAQREEISREIAIEVSQSLRVEARSSIQFREGSLEWIGTINTYNDLLAVAANVGGTVALCQLIASAINRVLRRFMPNSLPTPTTDVRLSSAPVTVSVKTTSPVPIAQPRKEIDLRDLLLLSFGLVNLSLAFLIAMVAVKVLGVL